MATCANMSISRRRFLESSAAAISLGFTGLGCARPDTLATAIDPAFGFGPLVDDPDEVIALPRGFTYRIFSSAGETMSDGFFVPTRHDGMATFPGPDGMTLLVRNHEITPGADPADGFRVFEPPCGRADDLELPTIDVVDVVARHLLLLFVEHPLMLL